MITGVWMNEDDGAMVLGVELDDGEGGLLTVDLNFDPPMITNVAALEGDAWVEMGPTQ
jgi:hypothetical protein